MHHDRHLYGVRRDTSTWKVIRLRLDGSDRHVIAPSDPGDSPSVSPDGMRVAYGYQQTTLVVPSRGGTPRIVQPYSDGGVWSPDGTHLATMEVGPNGTELFLVAVNGSGSRKVTDNITTEGAGPSTFSPDGKSILLAGSSDVPSGFAVLPVNGSPERPLDPSVLGGDATRLP